MDYITSNQYDGRTRRLYPKLCVICKQQFYVPKHVYLERRTCSKVCSGEEVRLHGSKKYSLNEAFFSKQTPLSCYWAGFIAADGCIAQSGNALRLQIGLSIKDEGHLELFRSAISYGGSLLYSPAREVISRKTGKVYLGNPIVRAYITSFPLCRDLQVVFGIGPRKSLTLKAPDILNPDNRLAFIAGLIDGDGCINVYKRSGKFDKLNISLVGTLDMLNWVQSILLHLHPGLGSSICKDENVYILGITGSYAVKVFRSIKVLELKGIPLLKRKWHIEEQILQSQRTVSQARKRISPEGTAWCARCKDFINVSNFTSNKNNLNGLEVYCKACRSERHKTSKKKLVIPKSVASS